MTKLSQPMPSYTSPPKRLSTKAENAEITMNRGLDTLCGSMRAVTVLVGFVRIGLRRQGITRGRRLLSTYKIAGRHNPSGYFFVRRWKVVLLEIVAGFVSENLQGGGAL